RVGCLAEYAHGPRVRTAEPLADLDGGRLAGTVGPEQREQGSALDRQRQPVHRAPGAVGLDEIMDLDCGSLHAASLGSRRGAAALTPPALLPRTSPRTPGRTVAAPPA